MKRYLITDPDYFPRHGAGFARAFSAAFRLRHPHFCCLRDKNNPDYPRLARRFLRQGSRFKTSLLLHGDWRLAKRLGARGVHLPESRRRSIGAARRAGLLTVCSCHTPADVRRALQQGAHYATLSPVYDSPGKGRALGAQFLKGCDAKIKPRIIALGGIVSMRQIDEIQAAGIGIFASIRYFVQKEI
ncbi:MAG: thiamine phosphate synthase [Campylobacterales bacterium]